METLEKEVHKVNVKTPSPLHFIVENATNEKMSVSLLEILSKHKDNVVKSPFSNIEFNSTNIKMWMMNEPTDFYLMRVVFQPKEGHENMYFRKFYYVSASPNGQMATMPLFTIGQVFSATQYQEGIVDAKVNFKFNGYSTDILFDVYPNDKFNLVMYPKGEGFERDEKRLLAPFDGVCINVKNTSDEEKEVDVFNASEFILNYAEDDSLDIYLIHEGEGKKKTRCYSSSGETEEYGYVSHLRHFKENKDGKYSEYDCFKIVNPFKNNPDSISVNGKHVDVSYPEGDFVKIAVDINFSEKQKMDSLIIKIPAKTEIMFCFGNREQE